MNKLIALLLALVLCLCLTACGSVGLSNYRELNERLDNGEYAWAIEYIAGLAAQNNQGSQEPIALLSQLYGTWYLYQENNNSSEEQIIFTEDGKCTLGAKTLSWILQGQDSNNIYLHLYEGDTLAYTAGMEIRSGSDLPYLYLDGQSVTYAASYVKTSHLRSITSGYWRQLDSTDEAIDKEFSVSIDGVQLDQIHYNYHPKTLETDSIVLELYQNGSDTVEYVMTMTYRNDYPLVILESKATGSSIPYYNDEKGYDETWPEISYTRALQVLKNAADGGSVYCSWLEKSLNYNDSLAHAMELLEQCGNYKDSTDYLARFTVLPKTLSSVSWTGTDNLNNVKTNNSFCTYEYDASGKLLRVYDWETYFLYYGNYRYDVYSMYYEYDSNGVITRITRGTGSNISAILTPTYDNGRMTALQIQTNSGTWTNFFYYDDMGRLSRAEYATVREPEKVIYYRNFTYDDTGRLVHEDGLIHGGYAYGANYTRDYIYDSTGNLTREEFSLGFDSTWFTPWTESYTYSYDSDGYLISANYQSSKNTTYIAQVYDYIYTDLYYYEFPAE